MRQRPAVALALLFALSTSALAEAVPIRQPAQSFRLSPRQIARQALSRAGLLALRTAALPAHVWPFSSLTKVLNSGEPFAGISPKSAARVAEGNAKQGLGTVIGRLAPTLRDIWSVRGAEKSFISLIDRLAEVRDQSAGADVSVAFDPDSLGFGLAGVSREDRERYAIDAMLRVSQHAQQKGVGVEVDMTTLDELPITIAAAQRIVTELKLPVRLAISARYEDSDWVLKDWAALARREGVKLGVRLVKGSYVENDPKAIALRKPLLEHYKRLITTALESSADLDVAVATHNGEIYSHVRREAQRLQASFAMHVIRGVGQAVQEVMRADGVLAKEYVSYGADAPIFGIAEMFDNWSTRRAILKRIASEMD